jgi:hypothetical protein
MPLIRVVPVCPHPKIRKRAAGRGTLRYLRLVTVVIDAGSLFAT